MHAQFRHPRASLWLLFTSVALTGQLASGEDAGGTKPTSGASEKAVKETPYAKFRSWKPVNPEPRVVTGTDLLDCRAPLPEERGNPHADGFNLINVYVSETARETYLKRDAEQFAEGTVIVKEKLAK